MSAERTHTGEGERTSVIVNPGICGFTCIVSARKLEARMVQIDIEGSECKQIHRFSEMLSQIGLRDIFIPLTRNPVFSSAEKAGCHSSCPIPTAVIKAAEAALGLALKCDVVIKFNT